MMASWYDKLSLSVCLDGFIWGSPTPVFDHSLHVAWIRVIRACPTCYVTCLRLGAACVAHFLLMKYLYIYMHKYLPCILTPLSFWAAGFECSEATILTAPAMGWTHDTGVSENVGPPGPQDGFVLTVGLCWSMLDVSTVDGLYDWTSKHSCRGLLCGHWQQHIYSSLQLKIYGVF
jgi:hypothetical protein